MLCAELLEQERSPALSVLLAGTLIAHGEKRGFKTLIKAARSGDQKTPISWLASKPSDELVSVLRDETDGVFGAQRVRVD